ncbi:MAG: CapA family protein [Deltaproteobacteria bacterium]|nr:CapA family protein [Deltaproteobacteria bacterium]
MKIFTFSVLLFSALLAAPCFAEAAFILENEAGFYKSRAISTDVLPGSRPFAATIRARAVFIGDIMVHDQQLAAARDGTAWDFKPHFHRVKPLFRGNLSVGNLETVLGGEQKRFAGYPAFNTPDELASALVDLGINIVMLANNHILDQGLEAALRTTRVLDDAGLLWTGLSPEDNPNAPLIIEHGGLRWAFVNYSYGSNIPRKPAKSEDLALNIMSDEAITSGLKRAAAYEPDITVAFFHWGSEYQYSPSKSQKHAAALCLENGADLVIGAHPHVLQPIEIITNSDKGHAVVAYSLGNFVSFQRTKPRERGVALAIDVEKTPGGRAAVSRVGVAPTWVSSRIENGKRKIEVVYSGQDGPFDNENEGLPDGELESAQRTAKAVLDFLGASEEPDQEGFYTLWEAAAADIQPKSRRAKPH